MNQISIREHIPNAFTVIFEDYIKIILLHFFLLGKVVVAPINIFKRRDMGHGLHIFVLRKMRFFALFLFSLSLFLSTTFSALDYFQLVLQWPPTYCHDRSPCTIPSPTNFTIHGLWPSDSTKYGEIKCPAGNLNLGLVSF